MDNLRASRSPTFLLSARSRLLPILFVLLVFLCPTWVKSDVAMPTAIIIESHSQAQGLDRRLQATTETEAEYVLFKKVKAEEEAAETLLSKVKAEKEAAETLLSVVSQPKERRPLCTEKYFNQKCKGCQERSLNKFRRGKCLEEKCRKIFKRCWKKKLRKRCGESTSSMCVSPVFKITKSVVPQLETESDKPTLAPMTPPPAPQTKQPTPAPVNQVSTPQATQSSPPCDILFHAQQFLSNGKITVGLLMENKCHLNWTTPTNITMDVCLSCPSDRTKRPCIQDTIPSVRSILGAYEEKQTIIVPLLEEVDATCSYSANFSATFEAYDEAECTTYRYRRECQRSHEGLPDQCLEEPVQVFNEEFEAEVTLLLDEEVGEELQLNNLKEAAGRAFQVFFTAEEECRYGYEECGSRDILASTVDDIVEAKDYEDGRRAQILPVRKRRKKFRIKGKRRTSARCRGKCSSREKVDDSISPGRKMLRLQDKHVQQHHRATLGCNTDDTEVVEDYDLVVQNGCFRRPDLALSLMSEGFEEVEEATIASILARDCTVDCGTDSACCGTEGCSCKPEFATPTNCVIGTQSVEDFRDFESCVLRGEDGSNLCCVPAEECPPRWEVNFCAARCNDLIEPPPQPCNFLLDVSSSKSGDQILLGLAMNNSCHLDGITTSLTMDLCLNCPNKQPSCINNAPILSNMANEAGSICIGAYEEAYVPIPVSLQLDNIFTCTASANFTAHFEAGENHFIRTTASDTLILS